ncbi:MAG: hypothetical protein K2K31_01520 [Clostridia bacterium]|nr:hypothetical protein [Clostridia bacterium]
MKLILDDVQNENLYQNGVYVVNQNVTHLTEDAFDACSDLRKVIFLNPVGFIQRMNGYSQINGIFRKNHNLESIVFPEHQDEILFNILLNCASDTLQIQLSEKAHKKLVKDITDYNKTARQPFSTDITFKVYEKIAGNEKQDSSTVKRSVKSDADAGDGRELKK